MTFRRSIAAFGGALLFTALATASAFADCGTVEKTATAKTAQDAQAKAKKQVLVEISMIQKKHKKTFKLGKSNVSCVGGGAAIDANGNEVIGNPSCTFSQDYCF